MAQWAEKCELGQYHFWQKAQIEQIISVLYGLIRWLLDGLFVWSKEESKKKEEKKEDDDYKMENESDSSSKNEKKTKTKAKK